MGGNTSTAKSMEPLTKKKIETIICIINKESTIGFRNYAIVSTSIDSGLRASEIASVTLGQVSFDGG